MPAAPLLDVPVPAVPPPLARPFDLDGHRARTRAAVLAVAAAPVQHLPAALLDALQGSWGTPNELLGAPVAVTRLAAAR